MKKVAIWSSRTLLLLGLIWVTSFFLESWRMPFFLNSSFKVLKIFLSAAVPFVLIILNFVAEKSFDFLKIAISITSIFFIVHFIVDVNTLHLIDCYGDFCIIYHLAYGMIAYTSVLFTAQITRNIVKNSVENVEKSYLSYYKRFMLCLSIVWLFNFVLMFFVYREEGINTHIVNFVPFKGEIKELLTCEKSALLSNIIRTGGNVFFFTLLAIITKYYIKNAKPYVFILIPIILSSLLELSQYLLKNGDTDIDDIITNTLGFFLGLLLYRIFFKNTFEENKKCLE